MYATMLFKISPFLQVNVTRLGLPFPECEEDDEFLAMFVKKYTMEVSRKTVNLITGHFQGPNLLYCVLFTRGFVVLSEVKM